MPIDMLQYKSGALCFLCDRQQKLCVFFNGFFHFRPPPGLRLPLHAVETNENFGRISAEKVKRAAAKKTPLQKDNVNRGN